MPLAEAEIVSAPRRARHVHNQSTRMVFTARDTARGRAGDDGASCASRCRDRDRGRIRRLG